MNDLPAIKQRRTREYENVSKWVVDKLVGESYNGQPPCLPIMLYEIVDAVFMGMPKPSPSIHRRPINDPNDQTRSVFVLWTQMPRRRVASDVMNDLIQRTIG